MLARFARRMLCGALFAAIVGRAHAGIDVLTFHYNLQRTGWNSAETQLRPDTLSSATFGKRWFAALDGQVYGEPLVVSGLDIEGGTHDVVYAATEGNSVYALDAATGTVFWKNHLAAAVTQAVFERTIGIGSCPNINPLHGITGTPVIDRATNTLYVCSLVFENNQQLYEVFGVDIVTGETKPGWPVTLAGKDRTLIFHAEQNTQRGALTLLNGVVYIPFSSRCDIGEWHGWLVGVPVDAPHAPLRFFSPCLTSSGAGIWGSAGASVDADGHMYVVTGNGGYTLHQKGDDLSQSILRLTPTETGVAFSKASKDYFTPTNYVALNNSDLDLGGASAIVLPDHEGSSTPHLLATCGKDGMMYLVDRDDMGGVGAQLDRGIGFSVGDFAVYRTTPVCFVPDGGDYLLYATPEPYGPLSTAKSIKGVAAYHLVVDPDTGASRLTFAWTNAKKLLFPGTPAVSSSGGKDGILWVIDTAKTSQHTDTGGSGSLHAYDALTGAELYSSNQVSARDGLGEARKFTTPTIANGRVFLAGGGLNRTPGVAAYGILPEKGDVNADGTVDLGDATLALQAAVGLVTLSPLQSGSADMNGDGDVTIKDAVLVLEKAIAL